MQVSTSRRRAGLAAVSLIALAVGVPVAYANLTTTAIKAQPNPIHEITPAASSAYFAWAQNSAVHPNLFNEYAQPIGGGTVTRVNPLNTTAYGGGISNTRLAFQQVSGKNSDIKFYNLALHQHSNPPPGVNSTDWEWLPSITDQWILFGRYRGGNSLGLLFNLTTHSFRILASVPFNSKGTSFVEPDQVNGDYAVYTVFYANQPSRVFRYQISTHLQTQPAVNTKWHTAAAVSTTGNVYFDESGAKCGSGATLVEWNGANLSVPTVLNSFTTGYDFADPFVVANGGSDDIYYTRLRCSTTGEDIYRVTN